MEVAFFTALTLLTVSSFVVGFIAGRGLERLHWQESLRKGWFGEEKSLPVKEQGCEETRK